MAITEVYSGTIDYNTNGEPGYSLVTGTFYSPTANAGTQAGVYQVLLDASDLRAAQAFQLRIYNKIISTGTKQIVYAATIDGKQSTVLTTPGFILCNDWDVTLVWTRITFDGFANPVFSWSIRKIG